MLVLKKVWGKLFPSNTVLTTRVIASQTHTLISSKQIIKFNTLNRNLWLWKIFHHAGTIWKMACDYGEQPVLQSLSLFSSHILMSALFLTMLRNSVAPISSKLVFLNYYCFVTFIIWCGSSIGTISTKHSHPPPSDWLAGLCIHGLEVGPIFFLLRASAISFHSFFVFTFFGTYQLAVIRLVKSNFFKPHLKQWVFSQSVVQKA